MITPSIVKAVRIMFRRKAFRHTRRSVNARIDGIIGVVDGPKRGV
jgi:hypothetical protein